MNTDGVLHPTLQLFLVAWFNEVLNDSTKAFLSLVSLCLTKQNKTKHHQPKGNCYAKDLQRVFSGCGPFTPSSQLHIFCSSLPRSIYLCHCLQGCPRDFSVPINDIQLPRLVRIFPFYYLKHTTYDILLVFCYKKATQHFLCLYQIKKFK